MNDNRCLSATKEPFAVDKAGNARYRWKERLAFPELRLDASTNVVFEVYASTKAPSLSESNF